MKNKAWKLDDRKYCVKYFAWHYWRKKHNESKDYSDQYKVNIIDNNLEPTRNLESLMNEKHGSGRAFYNEGYERYFNHHPKKGDDLKHKNHILRAVFQIVKLPSFNVLNEKPGFDRNSY